MKTCIFQLYAPLVSWGEIAVGGTRRSALHPSRSGILGIIAAALGVKRDEEKELDKLRQALSIAVRVDAPGTLLTDFQTIQVPRKRGKTIYVTRKAEIEALDEKDNAVLSTREYRCDAYSLVAVCLQDGETTLEQIVDCLQRPVFHIYLGRKSAPPALPLHPQIVEAENLVEAFSKADFQTCLPLDASAPQWQIDSFKRYSQKVLRTTQRHYYWEQGMTSGIESLQITKPYDDPTSRKRWQFQMRHEYMAIESTPEPREEHTNVH